MRTFINISNELGLKKFLASDGGTLYFVPTGVGKPRIMVRHFDKDISPTLVNAFAGLVMAIEKWVELHPALARLVRVEQPLEVGTDFIARPHHTYFTSIDAYSEWEDPPEPPIEFEQMQETLRQIIGKSTNSKERLIESILTKSLLEPTGKTYFNEKEGKFIIVEPKINRTDIERWLSLF